MGETSLTDTAEYRDFCLRAATDPETFAHFRAAPEYVHVVNVSRELGEEYLARLDAWPTLAADRTGDPPMHGFGPDGVLLDPVMIRYQHDYEQIVSYHGDLSRMDVLEIGGGFGGLARTMYGYVRSHSIVDLPEVRLLQTRYLSEWDITRSSWTCFDAIDGEPGRHYDLAVSTFAFSELHPDVARGYVDAYLRNCDRGWMICNFLASPALAPDEILKLLPGSRWEEEVPRSHPLNRVLVWGDR